MRKPIALFLASLLTSAPAMSSELTVTVTFNGGNEPVEGAVVYLDEPDNTTPVTAEIYQKDRKFHPHALVIPIGSRVEFPNRDNTQHHVYSFSPAKTFNIELYAGKPEAPVVFDKPGIVELGCNIHDNMQAFIVVTETSVIGRTDAAGRITLTLEQKPPAESRLGLNIWHPRLSDNTRPVKRKLDAGNTGTINIELVPEPAMEDAMDLLQQRFREL
ncbi:methylamine utilization protein [Marinobacter sediminum]|uniref:methylamine utilization protein n=1 Tax=Marinobacter sediminum TaxID=256323 RepID=UPI00202F1164|nr:methylamine utilization protein [Marinobacter sediminum]MCM0613937.1 methylamine utilization protein [Marinobacter sediminum]